MGKPINILKFRVSNEWLEIELDKTEIEADKSMEILISDRDTKRENTYEPIVEYIEYDIVKILLDFRKIEFNNVNKNQLDVFLMLNNEKRRLHKNIIDLDSNITQYSVNSYKINNATVAVPYFTINNNLSILYGNAYSVHNVYCHKIKEKLSINAEVTINERHLLVEFCNFHFDTNTYYVTLFDNDKKSYLSLNYVLLENDPTKLSIDIYGQKMAQRNNYLVIQKKKRNILTDIVVNSRENKAHYEDKDYPETKSHVKLNLSNSATKPKFSKIKSQKSIDNLSLEGTELKFSIEDNGDSCIDTRLFLKERKTKETFFLEMETKKGKGILKVKIDLEGFINSHEYNVSRWDFYIEQIYDNIIEVNRLGCFNDPSYPTHKRYLHSLETESINTITPYITINNKLSIVIKTPMGINNEKLKSYTELLDLKVQKNKMFGKVNLELRECKNFKVHSILMKYRSEIENQEYREVVKEEKINKSKSVINFEIKMNDKKFEPYNWDVYLITEIEKEDFCVRIQNPVEELKTRLNRNVNKYTIKYKNNHIMYPYVTINNSLSLTFRKKDVYETKVLKVKEKFASFLYNILKKHYDKKDISLVYEKFSQTAQDNGYYYFKYVYENHPNENVYFLIDRHSSDYKNLKGMEDKVIHYMSFKHLLYLYMCKLLITSEGKGHCYIFRRQSGKIREMVNSKKAVFLRHGVTGFKKVHNYFGKKSNNIYNLIVASSDFESDIIEEYFSYNKNEIITTGLCRWDVLKDYSNELHRREIFLMPTWRLWLDDVSDHKFMESEYYENYEQLLQSEKLQSLLKQNNIILNFYIHPKLKEYISTFDTGNENIRIYQFGEEKVNKLLMRSSLLITDYSSVSWDQYYQKKPIVFFQFDYNMYKQIHGSYLNMEKDLFGDRAFQMDELINFIEEYINRDFAEKDKFANMRKDYFKYIDRNNSERTYNAIRELQKSED